MNTFAISISIEVQAQDFDEAYDIETRLTELLETDDSVSGVYSIDVEQTDGEEE